MFRPIRFRAPPACPLRERGANYISAGMFEAFAVRDGRLVTGQYQYSERKVAEMIIEMLRV